MSNATVTGTVHLIEETKSFGAKGFRKRLVVLEQDNGRFVNYIPIEFIQDSVDSVDSLNVGDEITVNYRLSGRKWQRDANSEVKFFLSAEGMSFETTSGGSSGGGNSGGGGAGGGRPNRGNPNAELDEVVDDGDVPF